MKSNFVSKLESALAIGLIAVLLGCASTGAIGAAAPAGKVLEPNKLVILSTTDVKGKNEPCG